MQRRWRSQGRPEAAPTGSSDHYRAIIGAQHRAMVRIVLSLAVSVILGGGLFACADREDIRADRMARQAATDAEDDASCRDKGEPGTPGYDDCRQELAATRARQAEIDYQKARDFDRVLGGLDDF
jgi:hypothetical protein